MNLLKIHHLQPPFFHISQTTPPQPPLSPPHFLSLPISPNPQRSRTFTALSASNLSSIPPISHSKPTELKFRHFRVLATEASFWSNEEEEEENISTSTEFEDLAPDGAVYQKTLRLVECSMFAAVGGLAYFLSNSLAIELMHGLVGLTMGSLWRLGANWGLSIFSCAFVRAMGAMGYVLISSFLIRENILALITINIHASLTYICTAMGINAIPSMDVIYAMFGTLLLLNCGFFVFLLHLLYAVFFTRLGMKASLKLPRWLEKAI